MFGEALGGACLCRSRAPLPVCDLVAPPGRVMERVTMERASVWDGRMLVRSQRSAPVWDGRMLVRG